MKRPSEIQNAAILLILGGLLGSIPSYSQASVAPQAQSPATQIDKETTKVLDAAVAGFDKAASTNQMLRSVLTKDLVADPLLVHDLTADQLYKIAAQGSIPSGLTVDEKNAIVQNIQHTQQVVDPMLQPVSVQTQPATTLVTSQGHLDPYTAGIRARTLLRMSQSVGRLLWADKNPSGGSQVWHFQGTVFVSSKGVVATNCHVIEPIIDIVGGGVTLKASTSAIVEFSDTILPTDGHLPPDLTTYNVLKVAGISQATGCDVAMLSIQGGDSLPYLPLSVSSTIPGQVATIGYPQLSDLTPLVCQYAVDLTSQIFCKFESKNPSSAKVIAAGPTYGPPVTHDGVGVFTYGSSTRMGQSGSPVIDLNTMTVVGVHYCCTGSSTVDTTLACTTWHPQNLKYNEAVTSSYLLADPSVKAFFSNSPNPTLVAIRSVPQSLGKRQIE